MAEGPKTKAPISAAARDLFPIEAAESDAMALFEEIANRLGIRGARRIFQSVLKRPRGKRKSSLGHRTDAMLLTRYDIARQHGNAATIRQIAGIEHQLGTGHSVEANEKRLRRLLKARRPDK